MNNVFQFLHPDTLVCHLLRYDKSGSFLEIEVYPEVGDTPRYALQFRGVAYFDGPVFWQGAAFLKESDTECLALLREVAVHADLPGDDLVGQFTLYTSNLPKSRRRVRIIAITATIQEIPPAAP